MSNHKPGILNNYIILIVDIFIASGRSLHIRRVLVAYGSRATCTCTLNYNIVVYEGRSWSRSYGTCTNTISANHHFSYGCKSNTADVGYIFSYEKNNMENIYLFSI